MSEPKIKENYEIDKNEVPKIQLKDSIKASENKQKYLEKHALYIEIPTCSVESSRIYKKNSEYFLQLCRYSIPGDDEDDNEQENKDKWDEIEKLTD